MKRLYFGHPINTYNTPLEDILLATIRKKFPGWEIENPNQPHHQEGYAMVKAATGNGMDYFLKGVIPYCDGGVFLPFPDGLWGAGVFKEAFCLAQRGRRIYEINTDGLVLQRTLYTIRFLSVEETRARVYGPDGQLVPYC